MRPSRIFFTLFACAILPCISAPADAGSVMQPGAWELRVNIRAKESATAESKTVSDTVAKFCLSKAFLDKDPYLTANLDKDKMEQKNAKCSVADEKRTGNAASWTLSCTLANGMTSSGAVKNAVSARTLKSEIDQVVTKDEQTGFVKITLDGSFIGKCTKDMPGL